MTAEAEGSVHTPSSSSADGRLFPGGRERKIRERKGPSDRMDKKRGHGGAMAGPNGTYYYAENDDQLYSDVEFCWKVVIGITGLLLLLLMAFFGYQLFELYELSVISGEIRDERQQKSSFNGGSADPVNKDQNGVVGEDPFSVQLPEECLALPSYLPADTKACRNQLARTITAEMRSAYKKDGVVAIRGLLTLNEIDSLDLSANTLLAVETERKGGAKNARSRKGNQFYADKSGALFLDLDKDPPSAGIGNDPSSQDCVAATPPERGGDGEGECLSSCEGTDESEKENVCSSNQGSMAAFRKIALTSAVPLVAAELMSLDETKGENLRIIRDIFLAKDEGEFVCGYHVDDHGFWPAQASSPGINAWISIDDVPPSQGGTFALAVRSHAAPWKTDAHKAIGSVMTYPEEGFKSAEDMVNNRSGEGTCNLETAAPDINQKMEESSRIYDLHRGDVIFHERWLFHRTVPFDREVVHRHQLRKWGYKGGYEKEPPPPLMRRRYSIRYGPGSSTVIKGWGTEPSVLWNEENAGRTVDDVSATDGPWYPKSWPGTSQEELDGLGELVEKRFPVIEERHRERIKEMKTHLQARKEAERKRRVEEAKSP